LTENKKELLSGKRAFDNLKVHLVSLNDIFSFKSVTDREGYIEDAVLIVD